MNQDQKTIDISSRKVVTMRDVQDAVAAGAHRVVTAANCVITPSARDFLQQRNISLVSNGTRQGSGLCRRPREIIFQRHGSEGSSSPQSEALLHSRS